MNNSLTLILENQKHNARKDIKVQIKSPSDDRPQIYKSELRQLPRKYGKRGRGRNYNRDYQNDRLDYDPKQQKEQNLNGNQYRQRWEKNNNRRENRREEAHHESYDDGKKYNNKTQVQGQKRQSDYRQRRQTKNERQQQQISQQATNKDHTRNQRNHKGERQSVKMKKDQNLEDSWGIKQNSISENIEQSQVQDKQQILNNIQHEVSFIKGSIQSSLIVKQKQQSSVVFDSDTKQLLSQLRDFEFQSKKDCSFKKKQENSQDYINCTNLNLSGAQISLKKQKKVQDQHQSTVKEELLPDHLIKIVVTVKQSQNVSKIKINKIRLMNSNQIVKCKQLHKKQFTVSEDQLKKQEIIILKDIQKVIKDNKASFTLGKSRCNIVIEELKAICKQCNSREKLRFQSDFNVKCSKCSALLICPIKIKTQNVSEI